MVDSRKTVSARQARRTSRRVQDATLGSHVQRSARHSRSQAPADSVQFSDSARQSRARRQEVSAIAPRSSTADAGVYQRHAMQHKYVEEMRRRDRRRRVITVVVVVLIVLAVAIGAGIMAFMNSTSSAMALHNSDAKEALSAPKEGKGTYTLIAVELGAAAEPLNLRGPEALLLVYQGRDGHVSLMNIPGSLQVTLDDGAVHSISEAILTGDAALVKAVEKFSAIDITHFVKLDEDSLVGLIDALGGIPMELSQEIDDPHAGDVYLQPGSYKLNGHQALVMLRCDNLKLGIHDQMDNQLRFAANMLQAFFASDGTLSFASRLDQLAEYLQTDMSSSELIGIADGLKNLQSSQIVCTALPGYTITESGLVGMQGTQYSSKPDVMRALLTQIEAGQVPTVGDEVDLSGIAPDSFTIEIQNGASVVGAAAATEVLLKDKGFVVEKIGNAEQPVYTETLVIAKGDLGDLRAQKVIEALGMGRIVTTPEYYTFDTDVLLILGSDYRPIN